MNHNKDFDCVEMKDRIQRELMEEYERRREEFSSYADFINKTAFEDEEIRNFIEQVKQAKQTRHAA